MRVVFKLNDEVVISKKPYQNRDGLIVVDLGGDENQQFLVKLNAEPQPLVLVHKSEIVLKGGM